MKLRPLLPHDRECVVGITGSGKTTYVKQRIGNAARVLAWSIKDDYTRPDPHAPEFVPLRRVTVDELFASPDLLAESPLRLAVCPSPESVVDLEGFSAKFVDYCVGVLRTVRDCLTVYDELGLLEGPAQKQVVVQAVLGREWGQPCVFAAQRAVQIPPTARDQASRIVAFRLTNPRDIEALGDRIGHDLAARVPTLPRFQHVEWDEQDAFGVKEGSRAQAD